MCLTSDIFLQHHHVTRSDSLPRKSQSSTRTMLSSYQSVPREGCTNQSNATLPLATVGVYWWTLDDPYLARPPGGRKFSY